MKSTFKRYELKYFMTQAQKEKLLELFEIYMICDEYGKSSIHNIYYDTNDFLLIRRSIEKPLYKEKLRARSYGKVSESGTVFLEIKKKFKSVVYKRRIALKENELDNYFEENLQENQISKEIAYFKSFYQGIKPRVFLAYDREAFFGREDNNFRVTFDEDIVWRETDLSLSSEKYGNQILCDDTVLAEIKVSGGVPIWLTKFLSDNKIYKTSFSKYGTAYKQIIKKELTYV